MQNAEFRRRGNAACCSAFARQQKRAGQGTSRRERLDAGGDSDALGGGGDALGQADIPPALALVHAQDDAGGAGRMVGRRVEQQKAWPQLRHRDRVAAEQQTDPDISGMAAVAAEHGTYG